MCLNNNKNVICLLHVKKTLFFFMQAECFLMFLKCVLSVNDIVFVLIYFYILRIFFPERVLNKIVIRRKVLPKQWILNCLVGWKWITWSCPWLNTFNVKRINWNKKYIKPWNNWVIFLVRMRVKMICGKAKHVEKNLAWS